MFRAAFFKPRALPAPANFLKKVGQKLSLETSFPEKFTQTSHLSR
jgi:hypothetical protein